MLSTNCSELFTAAPTPAPTNNDKPPVTGANDTANVAAIPVATPIMASLIVCCVDM